MHSLMKLGLLLATAAQLTGCEKKNYVDNNGTYKKEYYIYKQGDKATSYVEVLKNDTLDTETKLISPPIEVRFDDDIKGDFTDSVHGRNFGVYYEYRYRAMTEHMDEFQEWRYNRQVITGSDTLPQEVYRRKRIRHDISVYDK